MQRLKRLLCLWGNAECGRLGLGDGSGGKMLPHICKTIKNPESVACGAAHTVVLSGDLSPQSASCRRPFQILARFGALASILTDSWVSRRRKRLFGSVVPQQESFDPEGEMQVPVRVEIPEPVKKIAAGHMHTLCLTSHTFPHVSHSFAVVHCHRIRRCLGVWIKCLRPIGNWMRDLP